MEWVCEAGCAVDVQRVQLGVGEVRLAVVYGAGRDFGVCRGCELGLGRLVVRMFSTVAPVHARVPS